MVIPTSVLLNKTVSQDKVKQGNPNYLINHINLITLSHYYLKFTITRCANDISTYVRQMLASSACHQNKL